MSKGGEVISELCHVGMAPELSYEQKQHLTDTIEREYKEWESWGEKNELLAAVSVFASWYYVCIYIQTYHFVITCSYPITMG